MASQKKFSLYKIFSGDRDGKGVKKTDKHPRTFRYFFKFFWNNIGLIFTINMYLILGNFPILIAMFGLTGTLNQHVSVPTSPLFGVFHGAAQLGGYNPATLAQFGIFGMQETVSVMTLGTKILFACGLLTLFTFGIVNVGTAYIIRNVVKGEPIFIWDDFWYAIRKNLKQGMIYGVIDLAMLAMIGYDLILYFTSLLQYGKIINGVIFGLMLIVAMLYTCMRFYIYIMMVTFDLSIFKLFKNSFIFALIGMKRNIVAFFGIVFVLLINYSLINVFFPLGIMMPFIITPAAIEFMGIYAAYPKMKEIMIDPYYKSDMPNAEAIEEIEPIFHDQT